LAVLLALSPLAQLFPPAPLQAALAVAVASHAPDGDTPRGAEPALGVQGDQPNAGVLPRLPHAERALPPPAPKVGLPRPYTSIDPLPPEKAGSENAAAGTGFHRSSVGTARKPTGPPS
jgi:hypothetical protein